MGVLDVPGYSQAQAQRLFSQQLDVARLKQLDDTASPLSTPPALLDLNYASRMALLGIETYTRAATDTYTDAVGATQTAAINTPAFDRQTRLGLGWRLPFGLKAAGSGLAKFNPSLLLPSTGYTLVLDVDRPVNQSSGAGTILSLNSGAVANRIELSVSSNYQAAFLVQSGGTVVVNRAFGSTGNWYGGPRRLVLAVKAGAYAYANDGAGFEAVTTGGAPAPSILTNFEIGGSSYNSSFFTGWIKRVQVLPYALTLAQVAAVAAGPAPVACWGDSLTAGSGASGVASFWPELLRLLRTPHSGVYNGGVAGETSTQIKTRMLADDIRAGWTSVFWVGRNDITDPAVVLANVKAMAAKLTHNRFLVMSVINRANGTEDAGSTAYNQIAAVNAALAAAFPNNYLDIRSLIVAASGGTNDAPSMTWSADGLHFNDLGYAFIKDQVSAFLAAKRWF